MTSNSPTEYKSHINLLKEIWITGAMCGICRTSATLLQLDSEHHSFSYQLACSLHNGGCWLRYTHSKKQQLLWSYDFQHVMPRGQYLDDCAKQAIKFECSSIISQTIMHYAWPVKHQHDIIQISKMRLPSHTSFMVRELVVTHLLVTSTLELADEFWRAWRASWTAAGWTHNHAWTFWSFMTAQHITSLSTCTTSDYHITMGSVSRLMS